MDDLLSKGFNRAKRYGTQLSLPSSTGIASMLISHPKNVAELVSYAYATLYQAKEDGRNCFAYTMHNCAANIIRSLLP